MKISSKRLEEVISEEIKLFTQEKKLEEKTQMAAPAGGLAHAATVDAHISGLGADAQPAALKFALKKGYKPGEGQIGYETAPAAETPKETWWDRTAKTANPITDPLTKAISDTGERETNEGLEQRKAEFAKQARKQAATMGEACGDVGPSHGAIKIKIKKRNK